MRKILLLIVVLVVALAAGLLHWGYGGFTGPGPAAREGARTVVLIPPGARLKDIAASLEAAGAIARADLFVIGVRISGKAGALKAGEYAIPSRASMQEIMAILAAGKSIVHKLTIAEGLTSAMAHGLVENDTVLTGAVGAVPEEGTLLPETYLFQRGMSRSALLAKMRKAQADLIDALWDGRAADLPFKTKREAVILASIVEKETGLPAERPRIAAVFVNRLRLGMKLQSDPTIIYGLTKGYPLGRGIRRSELAKATPYNTYVIDALPPTPICNPGRDAIKAVLHPMNSKDLYFVADGSGGHVFAGNLAEQQKNVAKWRLIEKARKDGAP